jgi:hypothetical protein
LASKRQLDEFSADHRERCGRPTTSVGFYSDVIAEAFTVKGCADRTEAYSVLEAIRVGATRVIDMERDDLMILVVCEPGSDQVDATLYDPMPGGSGLITQLRERFADVVAAALDAAGNCLWDCKDACDGCLATFRNSYYHRYLNRFAAVQKLDEWGAELIATHPIPPRMPAADQGSEGLPVNDAEAKLKLMMQRAGFPEPLWHHRIILGRPLGSTSPDAYYLEDKVCVYLDGLSEHIHGNTRTRDQDRAIREHLRADNYDVFEIAANHLDDRERMAQHFYRIARILIGRREADEIKANSEWFEDSDSDDLGKERN